MENLTYKGYFITKIKIDDITKISIYSDDTMENLIDNFVLAIPDLTDTEIDERIMMYIDEVI